MLAKRSRLTTLQVKKVLTEGRSSRGRMLSVKFLQVPSAFRCGVVVSKKLAKTAVVRNQVRRTIYRALKGLTLPTSGHAILFVHVLPQKDATAVFTSEIKKLLHV